MQKPKNTSEVLIYESDSGQTKIEVRLQGETVWLTQSQLGVLFNTSRPNITMHIKNIFEEGELIEESVCKDFLHTVLDSKRYETKFYNLDLIISLGYRVKSQVATRFRQTFAFQIRSFLLRSESVSKTSSLKPTLNQADIDLLMRNIYLTFSPKELERQISIKHDKVIALLNDILIDLKKIREEYVRLIASFTQV